MKLELEYGMFAKPLDRQMIEQGVTINDKKLLAYFQRKANEVNKLQSADFITEKEANKIHGRIHQKIINNLIPEEKHRDNFRPRVY